jgi:hypothetical protein
MPRKSKADILENRLIEDLERKCFDPEVPLYVQHRCAATLATMLRRRDKRLAEKAKAAAARRAEREQASLPKWPRCPRAKQLNNTRPALSVRSGDKLTACSGRDAGGSSSSRPPFADGFRWKESPSNASLYWRAGTLGELRQAKHSAQPCGPSTILLW